MTSSNDPLRLPCGVTLPNRLFKGAMSEGLGTPDGAPKPELGALYGRWAESGIGLLITGNVMVDDRALGEPGNVVLEDERHLAALHGWAVRGTRGETQVWMQLNHPGKQALRGLNRETVAPSAVPFEGAMGRAFDPPRALTVPEIRDLTRRFATAARLAARGGFGGVQLHAAHGYLHSQFLSPRHNVRTDEYGGTPENRRRFLLETFASVREAVGPRFPVSVKLNSSDFVRGGLSEEESLEVVRALGEAGCDLIEISGGTYEKPMMMVGQGKRGGFFAGFSERARAVAGVPIGVTGGFRDTATITQALATGAADMVGLARPLALDPDFAGRVLRGEDATSTVRPLKTGLRAIDESSSFETLWHEDALRRIARGQAVNPDENMRLALLRIVGRTGLKTVLERRRA
ncbi:NADH:flavin oxidoreductase/NADH oxidase family protein [Deinococcus lacus]|uniref:NADH:flavin oxidoreductase/NADH oxidase family protein n=1 Tax=Deinococcus lacus TaxID=392561 RepID=A0ABW1YFV5_9DEIO